MTDFDSLAEDVLRTTLDRPGWRLLDVPPGTDPAGLRRLLIDLGRRLAAWYAARHGGALRFQSLNWFSQLAATRPHRDGGPDGSVLLLGYEPTLVRSRVELLDHSRAAAALKGMHPRDFLVAHNPLYGDGPALLAPHAATVPGFDPSRMQVLAVNNSQLGPGDAPGMLGVLHHAIIEHAPAGAARPIASVLLGLDERGLDEVALAAFVRDGTGAAV
ncbi:MAG: hypothetical protein K2W96_19630 [Gemmataceae bacterium]|nr:hypothetical protein [Gemmataceae bacterium]